LPMFFITLLLPSFSFTFCLNQFVHFLHRFFDPAYGIDETIFDCAFTNHIRSNISGQISFGKHKLLKLFFFDSRMINNKVNHPLLHFVHIFKGLWNTYDKSSQTDGMYGHCCSRNNISKIGSDSYWYTDRVTASKNDRNRWLGQRSDHFRKCESRFDISTDCVQKDNQPFYLWILLNSNQLGQNMFILCCFVLCGQLNMPLDLSNDRKDMDIGFWCLRKICLP